MRGKRAQGGSCASEGGVAHIKTGDLARVPEVDVAVEVAARELTKIWMGWEDFSTAVKDHTLKFRGPKKYTEIAEYWLGCSTLAHIKKREGHLLVSE